MRVLFTPIPLALGISATYYGIAAVHAMHLAAICMALYVAISWPKPTAIPFWTVPAFLAVSWFFANLLPIVGGSMASFGLVVLTSMAGILFLLQIFACFELDFKLLTKREATDA